MDALLFSVRDGLRAAGFGYGVPEVDIRDNGMPPPRCGNFFVAVHPGSTRNGAMNNLDEYFDFKLTLTQRVSVPLDRIGDTALASKLARQSGKGNPSFNARIEQLRAWGSMNWERTVLTVRTPNSANDNIVAWAPIGTVQVYGFVEPAHYTGAEIPVLRGGDWFTADASADDVGLKAELSFANARRLQPQTLAVGPFI